jgi:hypothetical protein
MTGVAVESVGRAVYSRDGAKIGKLKRLVGEKGAYLVVGRFLSADLLIPADLAEESGDRLVLPFGSSFLDSAPQIKAKGEPSAEERARLERFYRVKTTS